MASPDTEHALLKLSGHFSKRQSSAREEGLLIVEAGQVFRRPSSGEDKALCAQDELKIESRIGKLERKIHFPDGQIFTTHDSDAVDAIDIRKAGKLLPRLEKFGWHLVPRPKFAALNRPTASKNIAAEEVNKEEIKKE